MEPQEIYTLEKFRGESFREIFFSDLEKKQRVLVVVGEQFSYMLFLPSAKVTEEGQEVELALERVTSADSLALGEDLLVD